MSTASAVITGLALAVCYADTLRGMFNQWTTDDDMSHGLVAPLAIAWVIARERRNWRAALGEPSLWGWLLLAAGAGLHLSGMLGAGLFAASLALLCSAAGAVAALGGWRLLRACWFPFLLACFMLPKLAILYNRTTLPMQLTASYLAAKLLVVLGYGVMRAGNILEVGGHQVMVAEACNGLRYLLPMSFVALLLGYLAGARAWVRCALFAAAAPLAVLANAVRVAASGANPAWASGDPHTTMGQVVFAASLLAMALVYLLLERVDRRWAHANL